MKWTVLSDNRSNDSQLETEHGLSILLETEEELTALAQKLKAKHPETLFYTSHCTSDKVFAILKTVMGEQLHAFSCGTAIE